MKKERRKNKGKKDDEDNEKNTGDESDVDDAKSDTRLANLGRCAHGVAERMWGACRAVFEGVRRACGSVQSVCQPLLSVFALSCPDERVPSNSRAKTTRSPSSRKYMRSAPRGAGLARVAVNR